MKSDFWLKKWKINQIGFHKNTFNENLIKNFNKLEISNGHILVPLAGKTLDILWLLSQGHRVTAIELSSIAITTFFDEHNLSYDKSTEGEFTYYTSKNLTFIQGDIFRFDFKSLSIDGIYDRASIVALNSTQRLDYALIINSLLESSAKLLMVTLEYNQSIFDGPPFSVTENEVHELFKFQAIDKLSESITTNKPKNFGENNQMIEKVYMLQAGIK